MIQSKKHLLFFFLFSTICLNSLFAQKQKKVTINNIDSVSTYTLNDISFSEYIKNVDLLIDSTLLQCDYAIRNLSNDIFRAYGHVFIHHENKAIWADSMLYNSRDQWADLFGKIIIKQDSSTIYGSKIRFFFDSEDAIFKAPFKLIDTEGTIVADSGYYYNEPDSAICISNVRILDKDANYIEGQRVEVNRKSKTYLVIDQVYLESPEEGTRLTGQYLFSDSTGYRHISDQVFVQKIEEDKNDTVYVWANDIHITENRVDSTYKLDAFEDVKYWSPNFSSYSDTLYYDQSTDIVLLQSHARAWNQKTQLSGPFIRAKMKDDFVDFIKAFPQAISVQEDSLTSRFNQISADTIHIQFADSSLNFIDALNNAKLIYQKTDEEDQPDGAIQMQSFQTILLFEDGKIADLKAYRGNQEAQINGKVLPENESINDLKLELYQWEPALRPERPKILPKPRFTPPDTLAPFTFPSHYKADFK